MELLKRRILEDGIVKEGNILKVDSFLNHQIDVALMNEIGKEFYALFADKRVDKILTIEASGIGLAVIAAQYFNVPVIFAKKAKSKNIDGDVYSTVIHSYTYNLDYTVMVSKKYLLPQDNILIIDDFLAVGKALHGLVEIVNQCGATLAGAGIAIEKRFQGGGDSLRASGINLKSLAIIENMDGGAITFAEGV